MLIVKTNQNSLFNWRRWKRIFRWYSFFFNWSHSKYSSLIEIILQKHIFQLKHPLKAKSPIEVTEEGIVIRVNDEQSLKALVSIDVTDEQLEKALPSIQVTDEGIVISSNDSQFLKAKPSI